MLKKSSEIAVGDWVVLSHLVISRIIGEPWQVSEIAKSRVYLQRWRPHPVTGAPEIAQEKHAQLKSVLYAFSTEASAQEAYRFARDNSEEYERLARELERSYRKRFTDKMAEMPRSGPPVKT